MLKLCGIGVAMDNIFQDKNHHVIVAEENGEIVSSCVCVIIPNMTHNQQPYAFIEHVITDEKFRKRGVAAQQEYNRISWHMGINVSIPEMEQVRN